MHTGIMKVNTFCACLFPADVPCHHLWPGEGCTHSADVAADAFPTLTDGPDRPWHSTGTAAGCHTTRKRERGEENIYRPFFVFYAPVPLKYLSSVFFLYFFFPLSLLTASLWTHLKYKINMQSVMSKKILTAMSSLTCWFDVRSREICKINM